ncbi:hypothetical protein MBAV_003985 [Candidatus Magnetobacterium bavaricum]|uniref:Uncharacterized protein n=1 Tax=Candidatus Magnetobacterium bavaricum TaxID=29290 RepID=A0A0F3GPH6_9BACT|nr:hypothetical protein MBAV_003985 [Candidatus Magnetobacterium bavaricum]
MALRLSTGLRNKMLGINTNMFTNGTFASDFTGWSQLSGTTVRNSGTGADGSAGFASCTGSGAAVGKFTTAAAITVKSNQLYRVSYYYQKPVSGGVSGKCMVGSTSGGNELLEVIHDDAAGSWVKKDLVFRTGSSTTSIYLSFETSSTGASDVCYFDEITLSHAAASVQEIFRKGFIKIYTGSQPTTSNDAPTGTLLCTIYSDGSAAGLTFGDSSAGVLAKTVGETWSGTAVATGTAGWFRLVAPSDGGSSSQTDERLDGSVATSGAQLNMSSTSISSGAVQTISTFSITMPAE